MKILEVLHPSFTLNVSAPSEIDPTAALRSARRFIDRALADVVKQSGQVDEIVTSELCNQDALEGIA